jgi:hypothetical protein
VFTFELTKFEASIIRIIPEGHPRLGRYDVVVETNKNESKHVSVLREKSSLLKSFKVNKKSGKYSLDSGLGFV